MKQLSIPYLRMAGLSLAIASVFTAGCEVSLKDKESERDEVQFQSWNADGYSFVKCSSSKDDNYIANICGSKAGESTALTNYNWHTNCSGASCSSVSVFAHYMLNDNLGAQQTLHIEAFDNAQFTNAPVASLEISGFDASKPASSGREELFLAPGEYYFRAYLAQGGSTPVPYSLQGMELVSDSPVGVLGALSSAERILVKSAKAEEAVHIYINQLFKKPQTEEDSLAKIRLQIALPTATTVEKYRDVRILFLKEADLEITPAYSFNVSSNSFLADTLTSEFVSPSVKPGAYYVFTYVDANSNGFVDAGELGSFVTVNNEIAAIQIDANRTKNLSTTLAPYVL